jgi:hypothetical protein
LTDRANRLCFPSFKNKTIISICFSVFSGKRFD